MEGCCSEGGVGKDDVLLLGVNLLGVGGDRTKLMRLLSILLLLWGDGLLPEETAGLGAKCWLLTAFDLGTKRGSGVVVSSSDMAGTSRSSSSQTRELFGGNPGERSGKGEKRVHSVVEYPSRPLCAGTV